MFQKCKAETKYKIAGKKEATKPRVLVVKLESSIRKFPIVMTGLTVNE